MAPSGQIAGKEAAVLRRAAYEPESDRQIRGGPGGDLSNPSNPHLIRSNQQHAPNDRAPTQHPYTRRTYIPYTYTDRGRGRHVSRLVREPCWRRDRLWRRGPCPVRRTTTRSARGTLRLVRSADRRAAPGIRRRRGECHAGVHHPRDVAGLDRRHSAGAAGDRTLFRGRRPRPAVRVQERAV